MSRFSPATRQVFSAWGLLGGALFVISTANAVTAVSLIGVSAATGVWCGVAVLCSFAWGVLVVGDQVDNMQQALAALAVILLGIAGIVAAAWAGSSEEDTADEAEEGEACALGDEPEGGAALLPVQLGQLLSRAAAPPAARE
jgi:glucose uptake protein GlcU